MKLTHSSPADRANDPGAGTVAFINVSAGGVPKLPVSNAHVDSHGVAGDRQANLVHHGGVDRAVCLFSLERIEAMRAEGHPIAPGSTGENLTIQGIAWDRVVPGSRLQVGDHLLLEITSYAAPCRTIRGSFSGERFSRMSQKRFTGWSRVYARVVASGEVHPGDPVTFVHDHA